METTQLGPHSQQRREMRIANRAACLLCLRDSGTLTVAHLAELVGLSRPTIQAVLSELEAEGRVAEVLVDEELPRSVGRPARSYRFVSEQSYVAGIDVGVHSLRAKVADLSGNLVGGADLEFPDREISGAERIAVIRSLVEDLVGQAIPDLSKLDTVVLAVPGIVDAEGIVLLSNPVPEWTGVDVGAFIGENLGARIVLENDINMAALAEHRLVLDQAVGNLIFVHVGHRMNIGLILGGQLHRGRNYSAGEVADIENVQWISFGGESVNSARSGALPDPGEILRAAAAGDKRAEKELLRFAERVSGTIGAVSVAIDPDLVVIGGGLSGAGETLAKPIREAVARLIRDRPAPIILASTLGASGSVYGSMVRAFEIVNKQRFGAARLPSAAFGWPAL